MTTAFIVLGWLGAAFVNSGFMYADLRGIGGDVLTSPEHYREDSALSIGFSLIFGPFALLVSPFITGFYQHGWRAPWRWEK